MGLGPLPGFSYVCLLPPLAAVAFLLSLWCLVGFPSNLRITSFSVYSPFGSLLIGGSPRLVRLAAPFLRFFLSFRCSLPSSDTLVTAPV